MEVMFTLDYELFMGSRTGTPLNCLIRPMEELSSIADRNHFKYVIFVDSAYLLRLSQLKDKYDSVNNEYESVKENVRTLAANGHDIEMHFHPQWIYSDWDDINSKWVLDQNHYKLSDMEPELAFDSFKMAKDLLDSIIGYKTIAFRAGGFCLDNCFDFKRLFLENDILIDSSVARYDYIKSSVHNYDYRNIPSKQVYKFSDNINQENVDGEFTEFSISSYSCSSIKYLFTIRPITLSFSPTKYFKDGESISDGISLFSHRLKKFFSRVVSLASIDLSSSMLLDYYYNDALSKGHSELIFIGHPKNVTDVSLCNLEKWIRRNRQCLKIHTIKELYR